jgi:predicted O-methyltransferase YrrM
MPELSLLASDQLERYLHDLLPARDPVLGEMEAEARRREIPIVGPAVGRLLLLLAQSIGARRVLELGSAIGYSTIWWARAVGERGEVIYTDASQANADEAAGYFRRAGVERQIRQMVGDAAASAAKTKGNFDLIFMDIDKTQYAAAFRQTLPRLRRGGLFVADNVLWRGEVARPRSTEGRAMDEFNRLLYATKELFSVVLPLRDGVAVCRKVE